MEEERYRAAVDDARAHLGAGGDLDSVLADMRTDGLSEIHCINAVHELLGVNLGRARAMVYLSPAFADRRVRDSVVGALREVNEIAQRNITLEIGGPEDELVGGPAQQLGDFRAAMALHLGMVEAEGTAERTVLVVPTDGEIIDEVRRLRDQVPRLKIN